MPDPPESSMPRDWNDREGWDRYYQSLLARPDFDPADQELGTITFEELPGLVADLTSQGLRSAWVPGCGLSPMAHLLAGLGLDVVATDLSPAAVRFQQSAGERFAPSLDKLGHPARRGSLRVQEHDFRNEYLHEAFDWIINVKAIQGFPTHDMERIARVHARALRPGRNAIFDTMNVQGERRDHLEEALEDGGFRVPFAALNRWYRRALRETGLPYVFVLGMPMIPRTGEYADDEPRRQRDTALLREVTTEYRARLPIEQEAEEARFGPESKVALVIYSTG